MSYCFVYIGYCIITFVEKIQLVQIHFNVQYVRALKGTPCYSVRIFCTRFVDRRLPYCLETEMAKKLFDKYFIMRELFCVCLVAFRMCLERQGADFNVLDTGSLRTIYVSDTSFSDFRPPPCILLTCKFSQISLLKSSLRLINHCLKCRPRVL